MTRAAARMARMAALGGFALGVSLTAAAQQTERDVGVDQERTRQVAADPPRLPGRMPLLDGAHLDLLFRNYAEHIDIGGIGLRRAWVQSLQVNYASGYTDGAIGIGVDVSPYLAVKLDGGRGARNMVLLREDGSGQNQLAWAYLGQYLLKLKFANVVLKYGLQAVPNPMLSPYNIRALPPTFRGVSLHAAASDAVTIQGGRFRAVNPRGDTGTRPLTTTVGGTLVATFDYAGAQVKFADDGRLLLFANRASDVWTQYYLSAAGGWDWGGRIRWNGGADLYVTRDTGRRLQGTIDNKAASLSLSGTHGPSTLGIGVQRIVGEHYFDYMQETNGVYLANSMGVDYNAPNERSVKLQYGLDAAAWARPGLSLTLWGVRGWGVAAPRSAAAHRRADSPLNGLYWTNGVPIGGGHHELGINVAQVVQAGRLKGARISFTYNVHRQDLSYPSRNFDDLVLMVDVPLTIF